jgi:hypothetical protein
MRGEDGLYVWLYGAKAHLPLLLTAVVRTRLPVSRSQCKQYPLVTPQSQNGKCHSPIDGVVGCFCYSVWLPLNCEEREQTLENQVRTRGDLRYLYDAVTRATSTERGDGYAAAKSGGTSWGGVPVSGAALLK